jgi:hypothetical protein
MKKISLLFLILGVMLLTPTYSGAFKIDEGNPNIPYASASWQYDDWGQVGSLRHVGGSSSRTGAYFRLNCGFEVGGFLGSIDDVIYIKAIHLGTKNRYDLQKEEFIWLGTPYVEWSLLLRPENWMYEGEWKIALKYLGSNGNHHWRFFRHRLQFMRFEPNLPSLPLKPSHVSVGMSDTDFIVSWSGIGDPNTQPAITYMVRILELETNNWVEDLHGNWQGGGTHVTGVYDASLNEVAFNIPSEYGGDAYAIRLENRLNGNRAIYYMVLPQFNP